MAVHLKDDTNLTEALNASDNVIVKYYADWCGSCKLFSPKFRRLSEDPRFEGITFLDVNAEKSPESRKLAGVDNLPFFAIFKNGEFLEGSPTSKEEYVVELLNKLNS